jgi:hypothetical protein
MLMMQGYLENEEEENINQLLLEAAPLPEQVPEPHLVAPPMPNQEAEPTACCQYDADISSCIQRIHQ